MNLPRFFIQRPIFATVVSILIMLLGAISYFQLPVAQYPSVVPPTIVVRAFYPGATPEVIAETVATPLEQSINGVEGMLYMESSSTADGLMQITVTFDVGTDVEAARVKVQNRVTTAEPRLPDEVRLIGVTTTESSPNIMMVVHVFSDNGSRDLLYVSNYVALQIEEEIARLDGVGSVQVFGSRLYSMRVWLDIERLESLDLTAGDVIAALRSQNIQVASGLIGAEPLENPVAFQLPVSTQGRLKTPEEFEGVIIKAEGTRYVTLKDIARVELGGQSYETTSWLNDDEAVAMLVTQRPGSNALDTADGVIAKMEALKANFPEGIDYDVVYNPTENVRRGIEEVFQTLLIASLLVVLTVILFLQSWRTALIPIAAIPVSLIGTFSVMLGIGIDLNTLSLFGLVLAIGIVVDDAIVVVENVERQIAEGLSPLEATKKAMDEVTGALIATTAVLVAVFVPTAFIPGLSGSFYQQFALTISCATVISTIVSLTLSPALAALLMRPRVKSHSVWSKVRFALGGFLFVGFNRVLEVSSRLYGALVGRLLRVSLLMLLLYVGLLGLTGWTFQRVPQGFVPDQDQGYLIVAVALPIGSSLSRTDAVVQRVIQLARETPGVANAVGFAGFSGATFSNSSSAGAIFVTLEDAGQRAAKGKEQSRDGILETLRFKLFSIDEGFVLAIAPPPIDGIGTGAGFKAYIQDRGNQGFAALEGSVQGLAYTAGLPNTGLHQVATFFNAQAPQLGLDIDRTKVQILDVPVPNVFEALQVYLGSVYVNDFNMLGRTYRVTAQADSEFRDEREDLLRLRTRSNAGAIVPLGSVATVKETAAPERVVRFNLFPAADLIGEPLPGVSTGQALATVEDLAKKQLPANYRLNWVDLAYQQRRAGNAAIYIFPLCVLLAFLVLAAQYESWLLPLAVLLIVPLVVLFALAGVSFRGMDNNLLVQIGFVVLIGLASKNAILIVEFARTLEAQGKSRREAAIEACRLRLRPILMTAVSFILGVLPLVFATGAGFEMRRVLGTTVFAGMVGVTFLGLFLTPIFYVTLRRFARDRTS